jgi:hypothetical protein
VGQGHEQGIDQTPSPTGHRTDIKRRGLVIEERREPAQVRVVARDAAGDE